MEPPNLCLLVYVHLMNYLNISLSYIYHRFKPYNALNYKATIYIVYHPPCYQTKTIVGWPLGYWKSHCWPVAGWRSNQRLRPSLVGCHPRKSKPVKPVKSPQKNHQPPCRIFFRAMSKNYFTSSDPHHDIYTFCYWQIFWHSIWHIFWHPIWHSIWQIFWHSIWQTFWHFIWHTFWHSFWHSIWRSIWHIFWHSIWPLRASGAHWARRLPGWGPAVLTELGPLQLRSSSAH